MGKKTTRDIVGDYPVLYGHVSYLGSPHVLYNFMEIYKATTYKNFMKYKQFDDLKVTMEVITRGQYGMTYTTLE